MRVAVAFVTFRTLFAMFLVVAVLLAPAIDRGDALAAVPQHDMQMMQAGHCHSPASHKERRAREMSCCTAMNVAVTPAAVTPANERLEKLVPTAVPLTAPHVSFVGELATPPPRSA